MVMVNFPKDLLATKESTEMLHGIASSHNQNIAYRARPEFIFEQEYSNMQ